MEGQGSLETDGRIVRYQDMNDIQFAQLKHLLNIITKLLALDKLDGKSLTERAVTLSSLGLETSDIADLLGKSPDLISQTLYQARKAQERRTRQVARKK